MNSPKILLQLFRFRIVYTKGVYCYGFDHLLIQRAVTVIGRSFRNLVHYVHSFDHLAECSIAAVQVGSGLVHDEKL